MRIVLFENGRVRPPPCFLQVSRMKGLGEVDSKCSAQKGLRRGFGDFGVLFLSAAFDGVTKFGVGADSGFGFRL